MSATLRMLKYTLLFLVMMAMIECAPSKKNTYYKKKKEASRVNTSQLGRNKYYYSSGYQKKLNKNYKKKK